MKPLNCTHLARKARGRAPSLLLLAGLLLLLPASTRAVPTATFEVATFDEFDKGEPEGTLVSSLGEVTPGRGATRLAGVSTTMIWSRARDPQSSTVYFGTGDGKVLAVRGGKVSTLADLKTLLVTALTFGPAGKLLAATMPGARVVEIDTKSGKWRELVKLPAASVWALLHDRLNRRIFAATGSPGKVFAIPESGGRATVYYDPQELNLMSLALDARGHLLVGSNDKAILYRVTSANRASAVHDFDATEVRDVIVGHDGMTYLNVNKFPRRTGGLPRYDAETDGTSIRTVVGGRQKAPRVRPNELRPGAKIGQGALYRIDRDGRVEELLALSRGYFTSLAIDDDGVVWAGDGAEGKVYLIGKDRTVLMAYNFPERQVLALAVGGKDQYLATGDPGAIYRLSRTAGRKPAYLSRIFDAKFSSAWGGLRYQSTAKLQFLTRSGNTAKPDATWSGWQAAKRDAPGRVRVQSPTGRYLQLRAVWEGKGTLRSFAVYYRPQNQRARVTAVTIEDPAKQSAGKRPKTTKFKIRWKVDNPDGDTLVYRLYYREETGTGWRRIKTPEPIEKMEYEWDTESVPDDHYRVRVVASDERSNGIEHTLRDELTSAPFLVDNRKPAVVGLSVRYPWVSGLARDNFSAISLVEFSLDGGPWRVVAPNDGIYDSPAEAFRIRLPDTMTNGVHVLAVRVRDAADNIGVAQVRFVR